MDQRELKQHVDALQKALQAKEPSANIVSLLEKLKKEVEPTEELLRSTKAGMVIAKQRANPDGAIAKLSSEIVSKWKKVVELEKAKRQQRAGLSNTGKKFSASSSASSQAATPGSATPAPASTGYTGDPNTRKFSTDGLTMKNIGEAARDSCVGLIYNGLAFGSREPPLDIQRKALEVEKAAFLEFGGDSPEYRGKMRSLYQNLKVKSNRSLGIRVLSGEITPERFVKMTHVELASAERLEEDKRLQEDNLKNSVVPMPQKSISDQLQCGRCKQKKVSYSQAQTRSADEPMTTFCECTVCGNRWKFS